MSSQVSRSALDGLPKQFIASMRTLFDIMDEQKTGQIKFSDIEARWREDETKRLPKGVVECLKKVTPQNGLLTFDRFCAGLKICLLRNKSEAAVDVPFSNGKPPLPSSNNVAGLNGSKAGAGTPQIIGNVNPVKTVPSQSVLPTVTTRISPLAGNDSGGNSRPRVPHGAVTEPQQRGVADFQHPRPPNASMTATVRPNIAFQQRTLSMPLLEHLRDGTTAAPEHHSPPGGEKTRSRIRTELRGYRSESKIPSLTSDTNHADGRPNHEFSSGSQDGHFGVTGAPRSRRGIMTVLHNWHMGMLNDADKNRTTFGGSNAQMKGHKAGAPEASTAPSAEVRNYKAAGDDFSGSGVISDGDINSARAKEASHFGRKSNVRRREPRRHTLASGIDYNMLKRMKQLEQEKDILLQGLEAIDKARSWYLKQIISVQDKMKYIGQNNGHLEYSTEAHQERLNFQMAQIFEVNQHLGALVESTERGFPLHMNLAIRQPPQMYKLKTPATAPAYQEEVALNHLKEINHLLSEEVSKKSERITQLEREKAALVRELFQARSIPRRESDDTTLM